MNYIDLTLGILLLYGCIKGFFKGFIIEVASLIALILGMVGALLFSTSVAKYISTTFALSTDLPTGVVFAIVFVAIVVGINLMARALTKLIKLAALGTINRLLGALFGGLKFTLIISGVLLLIDQFNFLFNFLEVDILDQSVLYKPIKEFGSDFFEWLLDRKELLPQRLV